MRDRGLTHLTQLERAITYQTWGAHWFWRTESGNIGDFKTADPVPTPEELTAMFAAIKLTD